MSTRNIFIHIAGCLLFLLFPVIFSPDFGTIKMFSISHFQKDFTNYTLLIAVFYLSYYWLIPNYYFTKKYFQFAFFALIAYLLAAFIPDWIIPSKPFFHYNDKLPHEHLRPLPKFGNRYIMIISHTFFRFLMVLAFAMMLRIINRWKQTEKEKLSAELSFLKAQMNPHFLFNTLNGVYALALEKSEKTPDALVKLSGMMRYVITESKSDFVPLEKEINYLSDYIELQKLRLGDTAQLSFTCEGETTSLQIAPMLLISFIENSFKYGVNPETDSFIYIRLSIKENKLQLETKNRKVNKISAEDSMGTGIINAKQQLQHIYPCMHKLVISDTEKEYAVNLEIELL